MSDTLTKSSNPFVHSRETGYSKDDLYLDVSEFARALAPLLDSSAVFQEIEPGAWGSARIIIGSLHIFIGRAQQSKSDSKWRVWVHSGVERAIQTQIEHHGLPTLPEATIDTGRPLTTLAADIKRRIIDAAMEPVRARVKRYEEKLGQQSAINKQAVILREAIPGIKVMVEKDALCGDIYLNQGGAYFSGSLHHDGTVTVQHIGSLSAAKAQALLRLLMTPEEGDSPVD